MHHSEARAYFPAEQAGHPDASLRTGHGTTPNGVQVHDSCEEACILDGAITDLRPDQTFTAGM
jgi:hypothetical protein